MKKQLDTIAEFYIQKCYNGLRLKNVLEKDQKYQKLIKNKRKNLSKETEVSQNEKDNYVLSIDRDFEILNKRKSLLKEKLTDNNKESVILIISLLEDDWRKPLIKKLNILSRKYKIV